MTLLIFRGLFSSVEALFRLLLPELSFPASIAGWNQYISRFLKKEVMYYPAYYRKGSVCIKREDPVSGKRVDLSENAAKDPFRVIHMADKGSFDRLVSTMELVSNETYERYLILLHNRSKSEAQTFRNQHEHTPEFYSPFPRRRYFE